MPTSCWRPGASRTTWRWFRGSRSGRQQWRRWAAGMSAFGAELGRLADGVLAPSQWEERVRFRVDVGPRPAEVVRSLRAAVVGTLGAGGGERTR